MGEDNLENPDAEAAALEEKLREKFPGAPGQWLSGLILEFSHDALQVSFAHPYFARWFEARKKNAFEKALEEIFAGARPAVSYNLPGASPVPLHAASATEDAAREQRDHDPFDAFLANEKNILPLEAARRIAQDAQGPAILVLYGGNGVGKTCLLRAIQTSLSTAPGLSSLHPAEEFFSELGPSENCEKFWQGRKALLLDDLQLLRGNHAWQEQLAALIDGALLCPERRMVFAIAGESGAPRDFEERLADRLEGGVAAEIAPPDLDVRLRYLERLAKEKKMELGKEQALFMARRSASFRQIQGLLDKARLWQLANEKNLDAPAIETIIKETSRPAITVADLVAQAARVFNASPEDIMGQSRKPDPVMARQAAMYLCRKKMGLSFPELGKAFGRDHSTVIHAIKKIEDLAKRDKVMHKLLADMENAVS